MGRKLKGAEDFIGPHVRARMAIAVKYILDNLDDLTDGERESLMRATIDEDDYDVLVQLHAKQG